MALRVVVDTNVYISAIFWGGKARQVIDKGRDGLIFIYTSMDIEREIAHKLAVKFHLNEEEVSRIIIDFGTFTIPVISTKKISFIKNDPDDDKLVFREFTGAWGVVSNDTPLNTLTCPRE